MPITREGNRMSTPTELFRDSVPNSTFKTQFKSPRVRWVSLLTFGTGAQNFEKNMRSDIALMHNFRCAPPLPRDP